MSVIDKEINERFEMFNHDFYWYMRVDKIPDYHYDSWNVKWDTPVETIDEHIDDTFKFFHDYDEILAKEIVDEL